jgi:hypothetical protein
MENIPVYTLEEVGVIHVSPPARPIERHDDLELVPEGMRHSALVQAAMRLRSAGFSTAQVSSLMERYNDMHCNPPLEGYELLGITQWVCQLEDRKVRVITRQTEDGKWLTTGGPSEATRPY